MTTSGFLFVILVLAVVLLVRSRRKQARLEREQFIRAFSFPREVVQTAFKDQPQLALKDVQLISRALRQFFLVHARADGESVLMPSKSADALWHAFILDTKAYAAFCDGAFGGYLHHIPEGKMRDVNQDAAGWRTWRLACKEENLNPSSATRLPLLYAIDAKVGWPGAVSYRPDGFRRPQGSDSGGGSLDGDGDGGCGGGD